MNSNGSQAQPRSTPVRRWHTVTERDTLAKLAVRYLGDVSRWRELATLNRANLGNPDSLQTGIRLRIPPR